MANYQSYKKINGGDAILPSTVTAAQTVGLSTAVAHQFFVFNANYYDACNGGCCLLWTVPSNTRSVRFELTGGGGSGAPGICCANGPSGGSGAYATKTVFAHCGHFTPGSSRYTICAGGTGYCSCCGYSHGYNCCGTKGCTSFVVGYDGGAGGMSNFCADGGTWGYHLCAGGCYSCSHMSQCCICIHHVACPYDVCGAHGTSPNFTKGFGIRGIVGSRRNGYDCHDSHASWTGGGVGPWSAPMALGADVCAKGNAQGCCRNETFFPGGGGHSPFDDGSCCWGGFGGAGLVVVSYWQ